MLINLGISAFLKERGPFISELLTWVALGAMLTQMVTSKSMQLLWGLINVMQLIVLLPLYNLAFPANAALFYSFLRELSNFEILPVDLINNAIYGKNDQKLSDSNRSEIFKQAGYESNQLIQNLGSLYIYIQAYIALAFLAICFRIFATFSER